MVRKCVCERKGESERMREKKYLKSVWEWMLLM